MKELLAIFAPQWWMFKNRLLRSDRTAYFKSIFVLLMTAGFWFGAFHYLTIVLTRFQEMEGDVGILIALKGLSLLLMLVFFLLIFSSLLSGISNFYLSNDLPVILTSPVSWGNIFLSKWIETALKSSWMILFAIAPVFVALGWFLKSPAGYYLYLFPVLLLFVLIPVGIGIMISIFLMAIVPAKRAKNIFIFLGLLILALLFLIFRLLKPERFANPEWFANLTIFIAELKLPVSVFLPSIWVTETLAPFFHTEGGAPLFYMLLLFFTAGAFIVFGSWLFKAFFYTGLIKARQTDRPWLAANEEGRRGIVLRSLYFCLSFVKGYRRALIEKDLMAFFRNAGQSSQLLLLFAIIIIYLFSIKALPVEWGTYLSLQLKYIISFLNIGVVAFVITAIAARLVLPSIDNEGKAFWIIRVSPVSMRQFLRTKFVSAFFPLLLLSLLLIIISNLLLGVKGWFMLLGIWTCIAVVASVTALAVGIGAYDARFSLLDSGREQTGLHATVYMLSAFGVIIITIMLEIIPTISIFMKEVTQSVLTLRGWTIIGASFLMVLLFNVFVVWLAMKMGEKKLLSME